MKIASKVLKISVIVILSLILVLNLNVLIQSKLYPDKVPSLFGYKPFVVTTGSMESNINKGDLIFVKVVDPSTLKVDDIVAFRDTDDRVITHRIVEVLDVPETGTMFRVKGDANEEADEEKVLPRNVIGKVMFRIPSLGKVQFFLASKTGWLVAILIPALLILAYDIYKLIKLISVKSKLEKYDPDKI